MRPAFDAEWQARFERFGRTYADEALVSGWSATGLRRRLQTFEAILADLRLPAGGPALDLGCGAGTYVRLLGGLGYRAVGLDYSQPSLGRALAADPGRKGVYVAGEAYALPFPSAAFDLVVSIGVLQALGEPRHALAEMARVLRPGGTLVVETLNARALPSRARRGLDRLLGRPVRVRAYDPSASRRWLEERGLEVRQRVPVWLPPRRLPALEPVLAGHLVLRALGRRPLVAELGAHTFLFVARKP